MLFGCSSVSRDETKDDTAAVVSSSAVSEAENKITGNIENETAVTEIPESVSEITDIPVSETTAVLYTEYPDADEERFILNTPVCVSGVYRECDVCGNYYQYHQIESSEYLTDEQIDKFNSDLDILAERGFPGMFEKEHYEDHMLRSPDMSSAYNPYEAWRIFRLNMWIGSGKEGEMYCYDPDTLEKLSWNDILGENWQSYCGLITGEEKSDHADNEVNYYGYISVNKDEGYVYVDIIGYKELDESVVYRGNIPLKNVNPKYLTEPEGWNEIREKMHQKYLQSK